MLGVSAPTGASHDDVVPRGGHSRISELRDTRAAGRYPGLSYQVDAGTGRVVVRVSVPLDLPITPPGWARRPVITGTAASFVVISP